MKVNGTHYRSIWYDHSDCEVKIIDQRWLPHDFRIVSLTNFFFFFYKNCFVLIFLRCSCYNY